MEEARGTEGWIEREGSMKGRMNEVWKEVREYELMNNARRTKMEVCRKGRKKGIKHAGAGVRRCVSC